MSPPTKSNHHISICYLPYTSLLCIYHFCKSIPLTVILVTVRILLQLGGMRPGFSPASLISVQTPIHSKEFLEYAYHTFYSCQHRVSPHLCAQLCLSMCHSLSFLSVLPCSIACTYKSCFTLYFYTQKRQVELSCSNSLFWQLSSQIHPSRTLILRAHKLADQC